MFFRIMWVVGEGVRGVEGYAGSAIQLLVVAEEVPAAPHFVTVENLHFCGGDKTQLCEFFRQGEKIDHTNHWWLDFSPKDEWTLTFFPYRWVLRLMDYLPVRGDCMLKNSGFLIEQDWCSDHNWYLSLQCRMFVSIFRRPNARLGDPETRPRTTRLFVAAPRLEPARLSPDCMLRVWFRVQRPVCISATPLHMSDKIPLYRNIKPLIFFWNVALTPNNRSFPHKISSGWGGYNYCCYLFMSSIKMLDNAQKCQMISRKFLIVENSKDF